MAARDLFLGLLGVGAGLLTLARPVAGVFAVALLLGYWWLVTGAAAAQGATLQGR